MINAAFRQSLVSFVRAQSTVAVVNPYRLFAEQGGRVTICTPSRRGLNRAQVVRVRPTRVAKSRG